jgi:trans-aconitate 3-methyltransferase
MFAEPEFASKCQPIFKTTLDLSFAEAVKGGGPKHRESWKRTIDRMANFLDDIEFKPDMWQNVERSKWDSQYAMPFYGPDACDFEITLSSKN